VERDISYDVDEEQLRDVFDELVLPPPVGTGFDVVRRC
jgi:hypothetical protein